jgi:hypothetical protein
MIKYTQYSELDGTKHIVVWRQLGRKVWKVMDVIV